MANLRRGSIVEKTLGRLGAVEISRFETATGPRLRLRRSAPRAAEAFLDPLELEGLTRVRYTPIPLLPARHEPSSRDGPSVRDGLPATPGETMERLQNEFALVDVGVTRGNGGLLIRDMNAGQTVLLDPAELEALLGARHRDFAPLVDTSDLLAIPEPDIDQA